MPSAIANDDRPASPQPAIVSPVPAPLTIKSLAGTYKGTVDEQQLIKAQEALKKDGRDGASFEISVRQLLEVQWIKIDADGTYESQNLLSISNVKDYGKVRLNGNELIFTTELIELDYSNKVIKCPENCTLYLYVTADGKTLLPYDPQGHGSQKPIPLFRGYVKQ